MSTEVFQQIVALIDELSDHERAALLAYVQQLEGGRVFLCQNERDIFLSRMLKELAEEAE